MQLDTQRKKIIILVAAAGLVLSGGALTIYTLKHQDANNTAQQTQESATEARRNSAATTAEREADKLFSGGDLAGAKTKYRTAAALFTESNNAEGKERVEMQLSLIEVRQRNPTQVTTDLSNAPVDRKLDSQLGVPPAIP